MAAFYAPLIREAEEHFGLGAQVEWCHYGSGYASFIDAWFYRTDGSGRLSSFGEHHAGIWVLLSRTTRYFVIGQGEKSWHPTGGGCYLPSFSAMDEITHPSLAELASPLSEHFTNAGLIRLRKEQLGGVLGSSYSIPGNLCEGPLRHFDALFHWED